MLAWREREDGDNASRATSCPYFIVRLVAFGTTFTVYTLPRVGLDYAQHFTIHIQTDRMVMVLTHGASHQFVVSGVRRVGDFAHVTNVRMTVHGERCRWFRETERREERSTATDSID